jgi:eukaryotic-like serine/threonine-protein kinase
VLGKIAYMSPEQVRGKRLDRKSDLFSLGVVLHELLVGHRLFRRETDFLTYRAITDQDAPDVREYQPELPAALAEVVRATLARDPAARPASARELGEQIVAAVAPLGGPLRPSEVADWMAIHFGAEAQMRRDFVVEAVQRRAREADRAAGRDHGNFDDLPTLQIDAEIDPARLRPDEAERGDGDAGDLDVAEPPAVVAVTAPTRVRAPSVKPALVVVPVPVPVPVAAPVAAPGRPRRRGTVWLAIAAFVATAAVPVVWKYANPRKSFIDGDTATRPPQPMIAATIDAGAPIVTDFLESVDAAPSPVAAQVDAAVPAIAAAPAPPSTPRAPRARDRRPGWLTVDSRPYANIYIDGRNVGVTPLLRLPLSPGTHHVRAITADGRQQRFRISIEPGREAPRRGLVW